MELRTVSYPDSALPLARARTQKILNLPNCLYTKRFCRFLQSYGKSRAKQNKSHLFFLPSQRNFAVTPQSYEKTRAEQNKSHLFFCRAKVTSRLIRKVTEKRVKCKRKTCFSSHFRVPRTSAKPELQKKVVVTKQFGKINAIRPKIKAIKGKTRKFNFGQKANLGGLEKEIGCQIVTSFSHLLHLLYYAS